MIKQIMTQTFGKQARITSQHGRGRITRCAKILLMLSMLFLGSAYGNTSGTPQELATAWLVPSPQLSHKQAISSGMQQVLIKVTGNPKISTVPNLQSIIKKA